MVTDPYWVDKPIEPVPDAGYITSIQTALKTLGFLGDDFTPSGTMDPQTIAALAQLQGDQPGIGSDGALTYGVVDLLNARMGEYNTQMAAVNTTIVQHQQDLSAQYASDAELQDYLLHHAGDDAVRQLLDANGVGDGNAEVTTADLNLIVALFGDESKAATLQAIRDAMDTVIEPDTNNFVDNSTSLEAPHTPTTDEVRMAANNVGLA